MQQNIRETLLNRKDQLLKNAYYEVARNGSMVENYLARSVIDNAGGTPPKTELVGILVAFVILLLMFGAE